MVRDGDPGDLEPRQRILNEGTLTVGSQRTLSRLTLDAPARFKFAGTIMRDSSRLLISVHLHFCAKPNRSFFYNFCYESGGETIVNGRS